MGLLTSSQVGRELCGQAGRHQDRRFDRARSGLHPRGVVAHQPRLPDAHLPYMTLLSPATPLSLDVEAHALVSAPSYLGVWHEREAEEEAHQPQRAHLLPPPLQRRQHPRQGVRTPLPPRRAACPSHDLAAALLSNFAENEFSFYQGDTIIADARSPSLRFHF